MKKVSLILCLLISTNLIAQKFSIFDVNISKFPTIKAKFWAFDDAGKKISNLTPADLEIKESGILRKVDNINCPYEEPAQKVSLAMSLDVSSSMKYYQNGELPIALGKSTLKELCAISTVLPSEFALQTCNDQAYLLQDFTTNVSKVTNLIDSIKAEGDNNFTEHLLNKLAGLLNIAKTGKYKRVAILYTDAWWKPLTDEELKSCIDTCTKYDIEFYAILYSKTDAEPAGIKSSLKSLCQASGGRLFDGILSQTAAVDIGKFLQSQVTISNPCEIEWTSSNLCSKYDIDGELKIKNSALSAKFSYSVPKNAISGMEFTPSAIIFRNPIIGKQYENTITLKAINTDYEVEITSSNPSFKVDNPKFFIPNNQTASFKVKFTPIDTIYTYTKLTIKTNSCSYDYFCSAIFDGKKANLQTLSITHPYDGEEFLVGSDTLITWDGIPGSDTVKLEYTADKGKTWNLITNTASSLKYIWAGIPNVESKNCKIRLTQLQINGTRTSEQLYNLKGHKNPGNESVF